jgi:hypothetical protein
MNEAVINETEEAEKKLGGFYFFFPTTSAVDSPSRRFITASPCH